MIQNALLIFSIIAGVAGVGAIVAGRIAALGTGRPTLLGRDRYANPIPTLALALLVPVYMIINVRMPGHTTFVPELALDRLVPLQPAWILVYGSMYIFAFLPAFVVRDPDLRRRAVLAYITVALVAYLGFFIYPTLGPRPAQLSGDGFLTWMLRGNYALDPPYNCFPSLHVAYAFVAALSCYRVHRPLGLAAMGWAVMIGVSTLYTKQHYVADVLAGAASAYLAYCIFLRGYARTRVSDVERRAAPRRALAAGGAFVTLVCGLWIAYVS